MRILSFDCANKSLGVCVLTIDDVAKFKAEHLEICGRMAERVDEAAAALALMHRQRVCVEHLDVYDTIPGKKLKQTTAMDRARGVRGVLEHLDSVCERKSIDHVLVEYQMNANCQSGSVLDCILCWYSGAGEFASAKTGAVECGDECGPAVHVVNPKQKRKIFMRDELRHDNFVKQYASNYAVNKAHSRANMETYGRIFPGILDGIKKKNFDDVGDALMQVLAWAVGFVGRRK